MEQKYEDGTYSYGMNFVIRDAEHMEEFKQTLNDFYGDRFVWPDFEPSEYPKSISITIDSKVKQMAQEIPLIENDDF